MPNINEITILDGAMGTMLQKSGVSIGKVPEALNITHPELVTEIHRSYIDSGSDIIYSNTFCANRYKLKGSGYEVCDLIAAGVRNAKAAAEGTGVKVALSVSSIGELLEPAGSLRMEDAYEMYREIVICGEEHGADLIVFETMTDLLETKAAVLAARENTNLPVYCTMTFEQSGRTFTGVSVEAMAVTLTALGVDAIGINCSLGPREILPLMKTLSEWTPLPLIVKANAGLPNLNADTFDVSAEEFADTMQSFLDYGVSIFGGCCGTTPEYIRLLTEAVKGKTPGIRNYTPRSVLCSSSRVVTVDGVRIIGERINPAGKKRFQEALKNRNIDYILGQGLEQADAGADILDINVGLPEIDEKELMLSVMKELQSVTSIPLQIDSSRKDVIESALRIYNGKPIVNSVNGEQEILDSILPLVKKYGAAVVGLTLDKNGIPDRAEDRFLIAQHITQQAMSHGIAREDIYIDCLTLTVSAQQKGAQETLKAMRMVKEKLGVKTVLGVSNISFGLPNRELINHSFLTIAMAHGLDCPIINPNIRAMTDVIAAFNVLYNRDEGAAKYIQSQSGQPVLQRPSVSEHQDISLEEAVIHGLKEPAGEITSKLLETSGPLEIVDSILIPALDRVGGSFEQGTIFLPQLIQAAAAAQNAFEQIKLHLHKHSDIKPISKGIILLATVKGDVHDIGKNIVKVILENYGYDVIDLGKDVPIQTVVNEALRTGAKLVGLSALMTTTVANMEKTIQALRDSGADCKIMAGGAVLTESYAIEIGADYYAKDAKQSADIAREVLG